MTQLILPFYVKEAFAKRYCKTIPVKHCPCKLAWLCDGLSGKPYMGNPYDAEYVELLASFNP